MLLTNSHTCLYGGQTANTNPPELEEYLLHKLKTR
jgi:hypothetical protein